MLLTAEKFFIFLFRHNGNAQGATSCFEVWGYCQQCSGDQVIQEINQNQASRRQSIDPVLWVISPKYKNHFSKESYISRKGPKPYKNERTFLQETTKYDKQQDICLDYPHSDTNFTPQSRRIWTWRQSSLFLGGWENPAVFRAYSWLCVQGLLLAGSCAVLDMEPR